MTNQRARQSNLEILRIISMILIVMSHCDEIFGLSNLYSTSLGINKIITDWLHIGGQIGVGCFVLISGYFMVEQNVSAKKMLKLVGEVWFYTIGIWIIWLVYNAYQGQVVIRESFIEAVYAFLPVLFSHYWFVTAYMILMVLSPVINRLIYSLDSECYKRFLVSILVIFVILIGGIPNVLNNMTKGRMLPVLIMYFIAGYIRRFGKIKKGNPIKHFVVACIFYIMLFISFYSLTYLGMKLDNDVIMNGRYFYRELNSPFVVVICVELFIGFLKTNIEYNRTINSIASCTFGVYLFHSNRLMSGYLSKLFPIYKETNSFLIFVYSIMSVALIYVISTLIDYIRKNSFERVWFRFVDIYGERIQSEVRKVAKQVYRFVIKYINVFWG